MVAISAHEVTIKNTCNF